MAVAAAGQIGLWALLGTITMLFAGFTSAYLVRRASPDWLPLPVPRILWVNTAVLLASSIALEVGRRGLRRGRPAALTRWLLVATVLGVTFLAGQLAAWRQLAAWGIYLPSSPHSAFFYMLTGAHGVHVLGGIAALSYALAQARRGFYTQSPHRAVSLCATYWHFVDGLWLYLFLLLFVW